MEKSSVIRKEIVKNSYKKDTFGGYFYDICTLYFIQAQQTSPQLT